MAADEFREIFTAAHADAVFGDDPALWITGAVRNSSGRVESVCIGGVEVEEAGIIEDILNSVPETLSESKRIKEVKSRIKKTFHVSGIVYPRWVQEAEWPVSASGKPMRFVKQKRKKGKEYENMLYTLFYFVDPDTGEERIVEQFT